MAQPFRFESEEHRIYYHEMGKRTAKQTWWFFEHRLGNNLPQYTYFRVFFEQKNVWLKDIEKISEDRFQGIVDTELPHDSSFKKGCKFEFIAREIDDWLMVDDYNLVGGFTVRILPFALRKSYMNKGEYRIIGAAINNDFIELSRIIPSEKEEMSYTLDELFLTGEQGFKDSLAKNLKYTNYAIDLGIEGWIHVVLEIDKNSVMQKLTIMRGIGGGLNDSVKELMWQLKDYWISPKLDGHTPQVISLHLPIKFAIR